MCLKIALAVTPHRGAYKTAGPPPQKQGRRRIAAQWRCRGAVGRLVVNDAGLESRTDLAKLPAEASPRPVLRTCRSCYSAAKQALPKQTRVRSQRGSA